MTGQKNFASKQGNILTLAYYEKTRKFPGIRPDNNFCQLLTSTLSSVLASAFNFDLVELQLCPDVVELEREQSVCFLVPVAKLLRASSAITLIPIVTLIIIITFLGLKIVSQKRDKRA